MEFPHLLVVQELPSYLPIEFLNTCIQFFLFLSHLLHTLAHVGNLTLDLGILVSSYPSDRVLLDLLDVVYPLQHVCDVIYASLLDFQLLHSHVQVYSGIITRLYQVDELLCQHRQRVVLPPPASLSPLPTSTRHFFLLFLLYLLFLSSRTFATSFSHTI